MPAADEAGEAARLLLRRDRQPQDRSGDRARESRNRSAHRPPSSTGQGVPRLSRHADPGAPIRTGAPGFFVTSFSTSITSSASTTASVTRMGDAEVLRLVAQSLWLCFTMVISVFPARWEVGRELVVVVPGAAPPRWPQIAERFLRVRSRPARCALASRTAPRCRRWITPPSAIAQFGAARPLWT